MNAPVNGRAAALSLWRALLFGGLLLLAPATGWPAQAGEDLPRVAVGRASTPVVIDGRLDDPAWNAATPHSNFRALAARGRETAPPEETSFRVLFDGEALTLGIVCREPQIGNLVANAEGPDGRIWLDDSVEVLLQPTGRFYYQFGINSRGTRFDARGSVSDDVSEKEIAGGALWDGVWESAVSEGDGEWRIELRIPLATLDLGPEALPAWRLNIGRTAARRMEYSAWAPVEKGFHDLPRFGYLEGITLDSARFPLDGSALAFPPLLLGRNEIQLSLPARQPGRFRALTSLREWSPDGSATRQTAGEAPVTGGKWSLAFPVPVTRAGVLYELGLEIQDEVTNTPVLLRKHVFRAPDPFDASLDWMVAFGADRAARASITLAVAESSARGKVEVALWDGGAKPRKRITRTVRGAGTLQVALPLAKLPDGFYRVEVSASLADVGRLSKELRFYKTSGPFER